MGDAGLNTNLASEYYVLSMLYRIGAAAHLTLGNKKSIDIVVERDGRILTIDVKGLQGRTNFPIDNCKLHTHDHYLVFVCFNNKIEVCDVPPTVYIVPSIDLQMNHKELDDQTLVYRNPKGNRMVVPLGRLEKIDKYKNAWHVFLN
jgi:hypothetical protein